MSTIHILEIKDEIRGLMAAYVRYADEKQWNKLAALFTVDGTFIPKNVAGEVLLEMKGRNEIEETIFNSIGETIAIHHLFSYQVEVENEQSARGVFSMEDRLIRPIDPNEELTVSDTITDFKTMHGYGHYHGEFIKDDGRWYISRLILARLKIDFTY
ncbi:hypothetical protein GCM10023149_24850 [Mucilaginibacter gynuensis]|uniref:SnoaL-like domain-containing protein n=1 Tax=Mucilaginibacter gynuensis TaxID=1302236 RepID=A0ABP8GGI3_9SPHI